MLVDLVVLRVVEFLGWAVWRRRRPRLLWILSSSPASLHRRLLQRRCWLCEVVCRRWPPLGLRDSSGGVSGDGGIGSPSFFSGSGGNLGYGVCSREALLGKPDDFLTAWMAGSEDKAEEERRRRRATITLWISM